MRNNVNIEYIVIEIGLSIKTSSLLNLYIIVHLLWLYDIVTLAYSELINWCFVYVKIHC